MPHVLWSLQFLQELGYNVSHATMFQDDKSAILLERHGKMPSSKRTKHIKAKLFFITDKVAQCEIQLAHMPTEQMWIDINTKPKKGTPFCIDRSIMMNCPIDVADKT